MSSPSLSNSDPRETTVLLSSWYERVHRKLPWRETRDPYRIWISEVMLQQTQVTTVLPYYARFLERFPTIEALAEAPLEDVLAAWSGLGYYSRARNLQKGAQAIVARFSARLPADRERLLEVPGIGPYTAGAIASIAFDLPAPIVDGNVQRVFARVYGVRETLGTSKAQNLFWEKAEAWVRAGDSPRILNQALMELGATVCIKGTPRCEACPIAMHCIAREKGWERELPIPKPRRDVVELWWAPLVIEAEGRVFLRRNRKGEWWEDLWDFPRVEAASTRTLSRELRARLDQIPNRIASEELSARKHTVTHHRIHLLPHRVKLRRAKLPPAWEGEWVGADRVGELAISSAARKVLDASRTDVQGVLEY